MPSVGLQRVSVGNIPLVVTSLTDATDLVLELISARYPAAVRLSNAYCVALAETDEAYRSLVNGPGLNLPDGSPVVWMMRLITRGQSKPRQVRGPSLFDRTLDQGRLRNTRHFFLGTTDETIKSLKMEANKRYPGICVAGSYAPPFGPVTEDFIVGCSEKIQASQPDVVWVALGTPKQDFAAAMLAERTRITHVAVGAAFDFFTGATSEAPNWIQRLGIEWLYRLRQEPKRLWKRYVFGNSRFILALLKQIARLDSGQARNSKDLSEQ